MAVSPRLRMPHASSKPSTAFMLGRRRLQNPPCWARSTLPWLGRRIAHFALCIAILRPNRPYIGERLEGVAFGPSRLVTRHMLACSWPARRRAWRRILSENAPRSRAAGARRARRRARGGSTVQAARHRRSLTGCFSHQLSRAAVFILQSAPANECVRVSPPPAASPPYWPLTCSTSAAMPVPGFNHPHSRMEPPAVSAGFATNTIQYT